MSNTRHTMFFMNKEYPNFGGGSGSGGSGSYSVTTLYENQTTASEATITLTDDLSNYDELFFDVYRVADGRNYHIGKIYETNPLNVNDYLQILVYQNEYESWQITSGTLLTRLNRGGNIYVKRVLGIKYGAGGGGGSQIDYSTTEQDTGTKWIDGNAVYQKTLVMPSTVMLNQYTWTTTSETLSTSKIISCKCMGEDGVYWDGISCRNNNGTIELMNYRANAVYIKYITLQYTKATS